MKNGSNWPRPEYVSSDCNFSSIAKMLMGMDFFYQADLVSALQCEDPSVIEICTLFAKSRDSIEGFEDIMQHLVLYDNEILHLWKQKGEEAANSGTWMHAMLEHLFNGFQVQPGSMATELSMAINLVGEIADVVAYRTEWCIYATEEDLAGSIDLVLKKSNGSEFVLVDWKRSEKLSKKYTGYGKLMRAPLENVEDCQGQHYRLQLNIFKWILQTYYGLTVSEMYVVCVHPVYDPDGYVDVVPDMTELVEEFMKHRRADVSREKQIEMEKNRKKTTIDESIAPMSSPGDCELQNAELAATASFHVQEERCSDQGNDERDFEGDLECILDDMDNEVPAAAKKRRLMAGAASHAQDFKDFFMKSEIGIVNVLSTYRPDFAGKPDVILLRTRKALLQMSNAFPTASSDLQRLLIVAAYISEGNVGNTVMVADAATIFWMVEGERHVRVEHGFLYIYDDDGSFLAFKGIPPEAVLNRVRKFFIILQGIFKRMKTNVSRDAMSVAKAIMADSQNFPDEDCFFHACQKAAREMPAAQPDEVRLDAEGSEYNLADDKKKTSGVAHHTRRSVLEVVKHSTTRVDDDSNDSSSCGVVRD